MSESSARQDRGARPHLLAVAVAALAVGAVLLVRPIVDLLAYVASDRNYSQDALTYASLMFGAQIGRTGLAAVAFAIGVFLLLWLVLPIRSGLRLGAVIGRGVLAAVLASAFTGAVALAIAAFLNAAGTSPELLGNPPPGSILRNLLDSLRAVLPTATAVLVDGLLTTPFAAVLVWLHGRR